MDKQQGDSEVNKVIEKLLAVRGLKVQKSVNLTETEIKTKTKIMTEPSADACGDGIPSTTDATTRERGTPDPAARSLPAVYHSEF
jgi:hypothetical protein